MTFIKDAQTPVPVDGDEYTDLKAYDACPAMTGWTGSVLALISFQVFCFVIHDYSRPTYVSKL